MQFLLRLALSAALLCTSVALADGELHSLWEIHGKKNTVYLLGSIHVLRASDYPLPPAVLAAYGKAKTVYMEINMQELDSAELQAELLSGATLPQDQTLPVILGKQRYAHAAALAHEVGVELGTFNAFAPWFAAEAIEQLQLQQLGFQPQSGVEMYFLERAAGDGKKIAGLETAHDQIAVFQNMPLDAQADYLISSLEEARDLPKEVNAMVRAWQHGDTGWFAQELKSELRPQVYESFLAARNRKWLPKIKSLLNDEQDYLVIVGTGHLVGAGSVIDLLKRDGIAATQL